MAVSGASRAGWGGSEPARNGAEAGGLRTTLDGQRVVVGCVNMPNILFSLCFFNNLLSMSWMYNLHIYLSVCL